MSRVKHSVVSLEVQRTFALLDRSALDDMHMDHRDSYTTVTLEFLYGVHILIALQKDNWQNCESRHVKLRVHRAWFFGQPP